MSEPVAPSIAVQSICVGGLIVVVSVFVQTVYVQSVRRGEMRRLHDWCDDNQFSELVATFTKLDISRLEDLVMMTPDRVSVLARTAWSHEKDARLRKLRLDNSIDRLRKWLIMQNWLEEKRLDTFTQDFAYLEMRSLEDVVADINGLKVAGFLSSYGWDCIDDLVSDMAAGNIHKYALKSNESWYANWADFMWWLFLNCGKLMLLLALVVGGAAVIAFLLVVKVISDVCTSIRGARPIGLFSWPTNNLARFLARFFRYVTAPVANSRTTMTLNPAANRSTTSQRESVGWFDRLFGQNFDAKRSTVKWNVSEEESVVGMEIVLTVALLRRNSLAHDARKLSLLAEVMFNQTTIRPDIVYSPERLNVVRVSFTPIVSGMYRVSVMANGKLVAGSPYRREFRAAELDPSSTSILVPSSLLVLQQGVPEQMTFEEKDKYNNRLALPVEELWHYEFTVTKFDNENYQISPELSFLTNGDDSGNNRAQITVLECGVFTACVTHRGVPIKNHVTLLVLSDKETREVVRNTLNPTWNLWYECYVAQELQRVSVPSMNQDVNTSVTHNKVSHRHKKVFCYLSPKNLIVKEYYWKIFSRRLYTFKIKPSLKITLLSNISSPSSNMDAFEICSSNGQVIVLHCGQRNTLVATFVKFLLRNIGGSESFEDKKAYFYGELQKLHAMKTRQTVSVKVSRASLLKDSSKFCRTLSESEWWKRFEVVFTGEYGLDYGGLMREWMHLLIEELFHREPGGLFRRFNKDDAQALIHPNPFREVVYEKVRLYELAGQLVGKCLVECSCGPQRQHYVKARFTRSFLAQILELGTNWAHFETDDKDYFTGKIRYILENDPADLDITFTEDVYDQNNKLIRTVDLKPNGSRIEVTEANKMEYLQRLAEFRLAESVRDEVTAFRKGLQTIVPESLLSMFDVNELELLICGMDSISVADWRENVDLQGYGSQFDALIASLWSVLSTFNQSELARVLQFTTGCAQLPPGGFAELCPRFQISCSGARNVLPTAHTCFNMLNLPQYGSVEELRTKLLIAVNEGAEGFGLV